MRKTLIAIALVAGLAILAGQTMTWAHGGYGYGNRNNGPQLTTEQQQQVDTLMQKHFAQTEQMRLEMRANMARLDALLAKPDASDKEIKALTGEIAKQRTDLMERGIELKRQLNKATDGAYGAGFGPGSCPGYGGGYGGGRGGMHGYGHGPGHGRGMMGNGW